MNEEMHNKKETENAKYDKRKATQNETNEMKGNNERTIKRTKKPNHRPIRSNPHLKVAQQRLEIGHGQ